jgi:hypothetical protein
MSSLNFMHIFPADPRQPKPDWPRLRADLIRRGFMLEPRGNGISFHTVWSLWYRIAHDRQLRDFPYPDPAKDLEGLVRSLHVAGVFDRNIRLELAQMSMSDFVAALRDHGFVSPQFTFDHPEEFRPGPLYDALSEEPEEFLQRAISYSDHGEQIMVFCGENTPHSPRIPGTNRVFENWIPFVDRWTANPNEKWIDPETGRGYGLLDFDWGDALGAGRCDLAIKHPGYLNPRRTAQLVSDIAGQPFRFSYCHL